MRVIPNKNSYICFASSLSNYNAPAASEVNTAVNLTPFVVSYTASTNGNQLPTPAFDSLFETTISGTVTGTFTMDMYRDETTDTAWNTLPRTTTGYIIISRFVKNGSTYDSTTKKPGAGAPVEVWPIKVTARTMQAASSNQVQMFQCQFAVTAEPNEGVNLT